MIGESLFSSPQVTDARMFGTLYHGTTKAFHDQQLSRHGDYRDVVGSVWLTTDRNNAINNYALPMAKQFGSPPVVLAVGSMEALERAHFIIMAYRLQGFTHFAIGSLKPGEYVLEEVND